MKLLYLLATVMFAGLFLMAVSSYKVMSVVKESAPAAPVAPSAGKSSSVTVSPDALPYVTLSYLGLALFLIGAVGAILAAFRAMTHRF